MRVVNRQRGVRLATGPLQKFLGRVGEELGLGETELVICFVTDLEMARMNEGFRQKPGPTDVLSFPAENRQKKRNVGLRARLGKSGARATRRDSMQAGVIARAPQRQEAKYLGDIAIAPGVARRNAKKYGRGLAVELRILMLHGVLHLLGYDHETDNGEMHRLEMKLRRRFGLTWAT